MSGVAPPALPTRLVATLSGHSAAVNSVVWDGDGRYCFTAGADRCVKLWNPYRPAGDGSGGNGLLLQSYTSGGHGGEVVEVACAPDKARFASVGGDRAALVWDTSTGAVVMKLHGHDARLSAVAYGGVEGALLATGSHDKSVKLWDTRGGGRGRGPVQSLEEGHDTRVFVGWARETLVTVCMDGCVRGYDTRRGLLTVDPVPARGDRRGGVV